MALAAALSVDAVSSAACDGAMATPLMIKSPFCKALSLPCELIPTASDAPNLSAVNSDIDTSNV